MKYDVFISYSRKDYVDENNVVLPESVVTKITELFDANGITYWFDQKGEYSGEAFGPIIARFIKSSKIFLFISSENSNASVWTSNEIAVAHMYGKKIIPLRYDDSVYNDSIILYIASLDYIDYQKNPEKAFGRLSASILGYLKEENSKEEKLRQEEERLRAEEVSRQERAEKLQRIREQISSMESRRLDIDKEILNQEKILTDLQNEKRIIDANISSLREDESIYCGNVRQTMADQLFDTVGNIVDPLRLRRAVPKGFFVRLWDNLKSSMRRRCWYANSVFILSLVFSLVQSVILSSLAVVLYDEARWFPVLFFIPLSLAVFIASLRAICNFKDGIIWYIALCTFILAGEFAVVWSDVLGSISYVTYAGMDMFGEPIFWSGFAVIVLLFSSLFVRKNGLSTWRVMRGGQK